MAVFTIGDLHLSTGCDKPMDIFEGWHGYVDRLTANWCAQVAPEDTVVLAGDFSWGMSLEDALGDFRLVDRLPGRKVLLKGNHDYWWSSRRKMESFFEQNGLNSLRILHNSCVCAEGLALCGTRGWMLEDGAPHDQKLTAREEGRLRASLQAAGATGCEPVVFLHYPPLYGGAASGGMLDLLREYGVRRCYYGHLHGAACSAAFEGEWLGITFALISADHLRFRLRSVSGGVESLKNPQ
ncbi:MAG: metallophosphoesterase [Oscillospiraceae bacterium]